VSWAQQMDRSERATYHLFHATHHAVGGAVGLAANVSQDGSRVGRRGGGGGQWRAGHGNIR
jgi:hypothetical protein